MFPHITSATKQAPHSGCESDSQTMEYFTALLVLMIAAHAVLKGDASLIREIVDGGGCEDAVTATKKMMKNINRPYEASATTVYADAGVFADGFKDKHWKCLPKAGVFVGAGMGHVRAKWSMFDAEAKGPNAIAIAGASMESFSATAYVKAEVASASASAGPLKATVGLSADTGIRVNFKSAVEVKVLGTGFSFGNKMSLSLLGNEIELKLWCGSHGKSL